MKTYTCFPGRLPALIERFQKLTFPLWKKHGIVPVAFFEKTSSRVAFADPIVNEPHTDTMVYIIRWDSTEDRVLKWTNFVNDPAW